MARQVPMDEDKPQWTRRFSALTPRQRLMAAREKGNYVEAPYLFGGSGGANAERILVELATRTEPIRAMSLAAALRLKPSSVVTHLHNLVDADYVIRSRDGFFAATAAGAREADRRTSQC